MIILILIYVIAAFIQVPGLVRQKQWRELAAFSAFYIAAFVLGLLFVLDVDIPSPMKGLQYIIGDVLGLKYPQE